MAQAQRYANDAIRRFWEAEHRSALSLAGGSILADYRWLGSPDLRHVLVRSTLALVRL